MSEQFEAGSAPPAAEGARCGLLVVEDDPDHRDIVREVLEEEGYQVEVAAHGRDALDRLLTGQAPDLILLDLHMPVMNGWTFMSELRAHPHLATIPVVVTTQGGARALNAAPVSAGYLTKPLERSRLLETIECCLLRRAARRSGDPAKNPK